MRCWVEDWLAYFEWWLKYYRLVNNLIPYDNATDKQWIDRTTLDDVLNAPVAHSDWKMSNIEVVKVRHLLLQRVIRASPPIGILPEAF